MWKHRFFLAGCLVMFQFLFATISLAEPQPMKLVYFNDFKPFSWQDENGRMQGILIDVLTEVLSEQMGITLSHQGYPWARAQQYVRNGEADGFTTVPTPERRTYTVISTEPVIITEYNLFTYSGNPRLKQLQDVRSVGELRQFTLVHYLGSGWAKKNLQGLKVTWVPTLQKSLSLLANKRYDLFIDVSQVIRFNIKEGGYQDKIIEITNVLDATPFGLCIGKSSSYAGIITEFDKTMRRLKQDGRLQIIYDQYRQKVEP